MAQLITMKQISGYKLGETWQAELVRQALIIE